jgi:competence protein ComEC
MKRPLVVLGLFYCLGIILAGLIRVNFWVLIAMAVIVFSAAILWRRKNWLFLTAVLCLALMVGCLNLKNSCQLSKCHIRNFISYSGSHTYNVGGFISSLPEFRDGYYYFVLQARQIQKDRFKYRCCGKVLIKIDFQPKLNYGDYLMLIGDLARPRNSGTYRDFLTRQDIYLIMSIQNQRQIIRPGLFPAARKPASSFSVTGLIRGCFWLRAYLEQIIGQHLPELPASVLSAMVLGQKRNLPRLVNNSMVKSGTVHILVVSGFNVGIVAFIVNLLLKILRFSRPVRIILTAISLLVYCLVTGATNPVIRATVMGLVFLAAYFLKREPDIYCSLVTAALSILVVNPRQLFDIGFQLSFASVLAIVYFYPLLKAWMRLEACKIKIIRFILEGSLVSFSAWLGTLIIIAFNFRIISPVTVLANILIVPLATLITLCGFTLVLSGLLHSGLAGLFALPCAMLITLLLNLNAVLVKLPFAYIYF